MNRQQRRAAERQAGKSAPIAPKPDVHQAFIQAAQLHQAGRMAEAEQGFRQVLAVDPAHADSLHLLGVISLQAGQADTAAKLIGKAVSINGRMPAFHNNLGSAQRALGRKAEAQASFRKALSLRPDYPRALVNLGQTLADAGQTAEAITCLRRALAITPNDLEGCWNLALLLHQQGALAEATDCYRQALTLSPQTVEIHQNLIGTLLGQGRNLEAISAMQTLLALTPTAADLWCHLGGALEREARITESAQAYREAVRHQPDLALAHNGLANALANLGQLDASVDAYRRAIELQPDYLEARSNLLMTLHSLPGVSAAEILAEARRYASRVEPRPAPAFQNALQPERRLRVGYVSADFRDHPVGFFLNRVLPAHDGAVIETFLYSDSPYADGQTERLRAAADHWRPIAGLSDAQAADMIRRDAVDILVDLAGHTGSNRLAMFAARAAPVQAAWLGYFGTTGLAAMDYVIADQIVLPPGEEALFTETPVRLPSPYLCWSPPAQPVAAGPFPALSRGEVTFGCFNNRAKITQETILVWSRILQRIEGSRLFLKHMSLADSDNCAGLTQAFATHDIDGARLIFEGLSPRAEALAAYNRVDIALDPFPFGGCTTTADTLWMGVPLVTLAGDRWSGRMSQSILSSLGLEAWVAADTERYVETAVQLAADLPRLADLRADLRARMEASSFCDGPGFTARLDAAYRAMWRAWCGSR